MVLNVNQPYAMPLIAIVILQVTLVPKRAFNVNFVPLIASKFRVKCDLLLPEHHCTVRDL